MKGHTKVSAIARRPKSTACSDQDHPHPSRCTLFSPFRGPNIGTHLIIPFRCDLGCSWGRHDYHSGFTDTGFPFLQSRAIRSLPVIHEKVDMKRILPVLVLSLLAGMVLAGLSHDLATPTPTPDLRLIEVTPNPEDQRLRELLSRYRTRPLIEQRGPVF